MMKIEQLPIARLMPYARNARVHTREQVAQLASSITEFGFNNPILIDADNGIIAGHGRVLAAHKLGLKQAPCIRLSHLTPDQKRAFILADNRISANGRWDDEILAGELRALVGADFDLSTLGFGIDELEGLGIGEAITAEALGATTPADEARALTARDFGGATSMARTGAPIRYWQERGLLARDTDALDYGSGQEGHDWVKYDIVHHPDPRVLLRTYAVVMCNFVLNVQPVEHLITQIVVTLWHCTAPGGRLLIAVRNDVAASGETGRGFQVSKTPDQWRAAVAAVVGDDVEMVSRSSFTGFIYTRPAP